MKNFLFFCLLIFVSINLFPQASPPSRINYQGVLRDASGNPLNGNFSMVFRFYKYEGAMTPLWEETYNLTYLPRINVSQGLFSVQLGDPSHWTGGNETNFTNIFSKYENVYLGVQVSTDSEMTPRIKVLSSSFSQNSKTLEGNASNFFLNTSSTSQTKMGHLELDASLVPGFHGIFAKGPQGGGYFLDSNGIGVATIAYDNRGVDAAGTEMGGQFRDWDSSGIASVAFGHTGVDARGNYAGGYFKDLDNSGYAYVGYEDTGIEARGNSMGGFFGDLDSSGYAYVGYGDVGIEAQGNTAGGYFGDYNGSGYAYVGYGDRGIYAWGNTAGGYFRDIDSSGEAYIRYRDTGIEAKGSSSGGYFYNTTYPQNWARLGAYYNAGSGFEQHGIIAYGFWDAGYFKNSTGSGLARLGFGDIGVWGLGDELGAFFRNSYVGMNAAGANLAMRYQTGTGDEYYGVRAYGYTSGGYFYDNNGSGYAAVGYDTYKIAGSGTVSFVQNHPYEKDKVIVYAAPEGGEIATYTRGTGKLINGEAKIKLGETFKWVTNPDIGLTVYLTPVGQWADLYVEKKSTEEIIVKSKDPDSNAIFDYIVYGLRIGFEESSIVQEKQQEAYIPSFKDHRERYAKHPDLIKYNALERFKNMESEVKGIPKDKIDLSRAFSLKKAIKTHLLRNSLGMRHQIPHLKKFLKKKEYLHLQIKLKER